MNGSIELRDILSQALKGNPLGDPVTRKTPIYLPPGYHSSQERRYPVVYFLHGFSGSGLAWLNTSAFSRSVPERIDDLISAKTLPPFIAVFVDGWTALGGSQWINSEAIGNYCDYLMQDVVLWTDKVFRTIPHQQARAVIGKSSGGYGALVIGSQHTDVFAHIACHSGDAGFEYCYLPNFPKALTAIQKAGGIDAWYQSFIQRAWQTKMRNDDHAVIDFIAMSAAYSPQTGAGSLRLDIPVDLYTARLRPQVWDRWLAKDPVRFVPKHLYSFAELATIYLECGTRDEFNLQWGARMVVETLREAKLDVIHKEFDDGHMNISYRYDSSLSVIVPKMANVSC
jgi:S-formylglutathione hydrolase FrmB